MMTTEEYNDKPTGSNDGRTDLPSPLGAVDAIQLAAIIRQVDGNHDLGAAALADAIIRTLPLPNHAAQLAAALKLPEIAALVGALQVIADMRDYSLPSPQDVAKSTLAALEARHE